MGKCLFHHANITRVCVWLPSFGVVVSQNAYMSVYREIFHNVACVREMLHKARSLHCVISFTILYLVVCELFHKVRWICLWSISQSPSVWRISQCQACDSFHKAESVILFTKFSCVVGSDGVSEGWSWWRVEVVRGGRVLLVKGVAEKVPSWRFETWKVLPPVGVVLPVGVPYWYFFCCYVAVTAWSGQVEREFGYL